MSKQVIQFKLHGETEFEQSLIDDAPQSGPFDEYADWILQTYDVRVSLTDSIKLLKPYGAWDDSELQDLETNKARLLWVAILDCKEQNTNFYYGGE